MISTRQKIFLARLVFRVIMSARRLVGLPAITEVTRKGLRWRLELGEGIDFAIFLFGSFEPTTVRAYSQLVRPGGVVLDIGANIGAHTLHLARLVGDTGQVYAFEPTQFAFDKLLANIALNPELRARITPRQYLLTDTDVAHTEQNIFSSWPLVDASSELHAKHLGCLKSTQGAESGSLDGFIAKNGIQKVDFIKMDVDGNEVGVLGGAEQFLRQHHPPILMELCPYALNEAGTTLRALLDILRQAGYQLSDEETGHPLSMDAAELEKLIPDGCSRNVLAQVE